MEFAYLTFIVTNDCNFNCSYCFQKKDKKKIDLETVEHAVEFFYPFLKEQSTVDFYGGEPLLAFDQIMNIVRKVLEENGKKNKKIQFNLTTNGSLLNDEILTFFNSHHFGILLSFDGLAQEEGRQRGTLGQLVQIIESFRRYPKIDLEINSVFTPRTLKALTDSLRFLIELECSKISFNISTMENWNDTDLHLLEQELQRLTDFLYSYYRATGKMPVTNYLSFLPSTSKEDEKKGKKKSLFRCFAGKDRMAVTPDGDLWGCYLFHDFFKSRKDHPQYKDYYLGNLDAFIAKYKKNKYSRDILTNYEELRMDYFKSDQGYCFLCNDVGGCIVCPVNAAYSSGALGKIPGHICNMIKIQRNAQAEFKKKLLYPSEPQFFSEKA